MKEKFKIYSNKKRNEIKKEIELVPISKIADENGDINMNRIGISEYETLFWYSLETPEDISIHELLQAIREKCLETDIEEPVLVVYHNQTLCTPFNAGYPGQHKKIWHMYMYNTGKGALTEYWHDFAFSYKRGFVRNPNYNYNGKGEYSDYYKEYLQCQK